MPRSIKRRIISLLLLLLLQLVENSSKKLEQTCKIISDAETNIRDEIHCRSDESNNNGTVIELRNDSVKTCNTINYMSRSSTIERDLILLPEMRVDLNSYVQVRYRNYLNITSVGSYNLFSYIY